MDFYILNLGCAKNQVDSEDLAGLLSSAGHRIVPSVEEAEIAIVNTCGFIQPAVEESVDAILELEVLKEKGIINMIGVVGCLVKRYGEELIKEMPTVDFWAGPQEWNKVLQYLHISEKKPGRKLMPHEPYWTRYLKISEGCNESCSYCTIPSIRGPLRSIPVETVISEGLSLIESGARELCVISQDPTAYGMDTYGKPSLKALIREFEKSFPQDIWVRLLYLHPKRIDRELLEMVASSKVILPYLDIPLQHVDPGILKAMNRMGPDEDAGRIFRIAREIDPLFALRTTLMVGFPGETEKEFNKLLDFLEDIQLDRVGAFPFYPESGTVAAQLPDQVDKEIKEIRYSRLMEVQEEVSFERQRLFEGKDLTVLIEEKDPQEPLYWGRSYRDAPEVDGSVCASTSSSEPEIGSFIKVRINEATEHDLFGEVIHEG
jgi:ribosomal protein S12 methylthiotransferase